ncbi:hypothetical protein EV183_005466 [Coemansia sp. RSA 2336]|nr:hypothetical protein EV183_005466 [Coemansia sp. RSA 2336]
MPSSFFWNRAGRRSLSYEMTEPADHYQRKHHSLDMGDTGERRLRVKSRSPKFFAKVTWVDTLSQLASLVPISQISIPQPVYDYNMKVENIKRPAAANVPQSGELSEEPDLETRVFGVPLPTVMSVDGGSTQLPRPVRECIGYIRHHGLDTEGLFRRSPPSTALRAAKDSYNRGQTVDLSLAGGVHVAAVLLKLFFRELPVPVFGDGVGSCSYETVRALPSAKRGSKDDETDVDVAKQMDAVRVRFMQEVVLPSISQEYRHLLCFICALLHMVERNESATRMTAYNLAVVWAPNMARTDNPIVDVSMCASGPYASTAGGAVQTMIQSFDLVFAQEIQDILGGKQRVENVDDVAVEILNTVDLMNQSL